MDQMHMTREEYFQTFSETDVTPRQKFLKEHDEEFLCACAKMILHRRLKEERMSSPCAVPYWPLTSMQNIPTEITEKKIPPNRAVEKEQIASKLQFRAEDIKSQEEKFTKENEWTKVKHNMRRNPTPHCEQAAITNDNNYYKILQETEEQQHQNEERAANHNEKGEGKEQSEETPMDHNVESMTTQEVQDTIETYGNEKEKKTGDGKEEETSVDEINNLGQSQKTEITKKDEAIRKLKEQVSESHTKLEAINNDAEDLVESLRHQNVLNIARLEEYANDDKRNEEKEVEWLKRKKEYDDKMALIDLALKDYDIRLEWVEGGARVYDLTCEDDMSCVSDDSSCDDFAEEQRRNFKMRMMILFCVELNDVMHRYSMKL